MLLGYLEDKGVTKNKNLDAIVELQALIILHQQKICVLNLVLLPHVHYH